MLAGRRLEVIGIFEVVLEGLGLARRCRWKDILQYGIDLCNFYVHGSLIEGRGYDFFTAIEILCDARYFCVP